MKKIESQKDIDDLLNAFDWSDAFVREFHGISPEYVDSGGDRVFYGASPSMSMLICSSESSCPSIEMFFLEVKEFNILFRTEFSPLIVMNQSQIEFFFFGQNSQSISAKALYYKILDEASWGYKLKYGYDNFFNEDGILQIV